MAVTSMANSSIRDSNRRNGMSYPAEQLEYLVVSGGGGGGNDMGGGGGAGGYRSSVIGEYSGGGVTPENTLPIYPGDSFAIAVGAGGKPGTASTFHNVIPLAGGNGGNNGSNGSAGGSGGGGGKSNSGGAGTAGEGFAGGNAPGGVNTGAGGGGALEAASGTSEGAGLPSYITASVLVRASGGPPGAANTGDGFSGTANTGNGAKGGGSSGRTGGSGGSGVIALRVPITRSITFSGGVTSTTGTFGSNRWYEITAAGPTDTATVV